MPGEPRFVRILWISCFELTIRARIVGAVKEHTEPEARRGLTAFPLRGHGEAALDRVDEKCLELMSLHSLAR
jgi:hypothetical protein